MYLRNLTYIILETNLKGILENYLIQETNLHCILETKLHCILETNLNINPDNTKLLQKKKFRDLIVTTRSCPGDKKINLKKNCILETNLLGFLETNLT